VIVTNRVGREMPDRATLWADHFRPAVLGCHAFRMTWRWRRPRPSRTPKICWIEVSPSTLLAVGITHLQRGNPKGATTLLRRACGHLAHADRPAPHDIDVAGLVEYVNALIDDVAAGVDVTASRLRPRLLV
jgi:hypothetical protein